MTDEYEKMLKTVPHVLEPLIVTDSPNAPIVIYEGIFQIRFKDNEFSIEGRIVFRWHPIEGIYFKGLITEWEGFSVTGKDVEVFANTELLGTAFITRFSQNDKMHLEGTFKKFCTTGEPSIPVVKIKFAIPNMKEFHGENIQDIKKFYSGRMEFKTDKYTLLIDKLPDYKERQESLKLSGGFNILYTGEIIFCKPKNLNEVRKEFLLVNTYLSFISGREVSCLFFTGTAKEKIVWQDYSFYNNDPFRFSQSWSKSFIVGDAFINLYKGMYDLWNEEKNFIRSAINWYLEANTRPLKPDSALIITQTALELIYNWLIVENEELIRGPDTVNISASNKIRLLLSRISVSAKFPDNLPYLREYAKSNNIPDAVEVIVRYRNYIVHSQKEKRTKILEFSPRLKFEAVQLSLYYIEVSLLFILGYKGKMYSRCSNQEEETPWKANR